MPKFDIFDSKGQRQISLDELLRKKKLTNQEQKQFKELAEAGKKLSQTISSSFKNQLQAFAKPLKLVDSIGPAVDYKKIAEEAEIRHLTLTKLRAETGSSTGIPNYDTVDCIIHFRGKNIQIPHNSDQELLCKVVLRNKQSMLKKWPWDEAVEAWGDEPDTIGWRKVYNAGRAINDKVAVETATKDFLIVKTKFVQLNPKFLR